MLQLVDLQLPQVGLAGLCIGAAAAIGAALLLSRLEPPAPERPWRWGDPPRRHKKSRGAIGHVLGALFVLAMTAAAQALAG